MTFWDVVCAVIIGNALYIVIGVALDQVIAWLSKPRYKYPRHGGTAKEVEVAWSEAVGGDFEPWDGDDQHVSDEEDAEPYLGWAGTTNYEEPHDCLLEGCLDDENGRCSEE